MLKEATERNAAVVANRKHVFLDCLTQIDKATLLVVGIGFRTFVASQKKLTTVYSQISLDIIKFKKECSKKHHNARFFFQN